jgi:hypothetical protein
MTSVGIVVITMDRPDCIRRQLAYFASVESRHTVYFGDSSEGVRSQQMEEVILGFKERVNVTHLRLPGLDVQEVERELLHQVSDIWTSVKRLPLAAIRGS